MPDIIRIVILGLLLLTEFESCCPGSKNISLGDGFKLSEYSFREVEIMYCLDNCCNSGYHVISQTIVGCNFDSNWIIAKTDSSYNNGVNDFAYWIFEKTGFATDNMDSSIKANLIGPLDSMKFYNILLEKNIKLQLMDYSRK
jgi:hypothetical protein